MGVSVQCHAPAALTTGERTPPRVPTGQEAGWGPDPVRTQEVTRKILLPLLGIELDRPVIQSIVRHYTDWATPAPYIDKYQYDIQE
jgi:hypothetical protein